MFCMDNYILLIFLLMNAVNIDKNMTKKEEV